MLVNLELKNGDASRLEWDCIMGGSDGSEPGEISIGELSVRPARTSTGLLLWYGESLLSWLFGK